MRLCRSLVLLSLMIVSVSACHEEAGEDLDKLAGTGVMEFYNPASDRKISQYGEVLGCTIKTVNSYKMELVPDSDVEWVVIEKGAEGVAGFNQVRLSFGKNESNEDRLVEMFVTVEGYGRTLLAVFEQGVVMSEQQRNERLNRYMHQRLLDDYLWADEYADIEVDFTVDYKDFLKEHLLKLGSANIEDGGFTKGYTSTAGERFIYSNIQPVGTETKSALNTSGLGFGPFFASSLDSGDSVFCLAVSYVRKGSPAEKAGIRRGDAIFMVNGELVTSDNYDSVSSELSYSPSGTYALVCFRNGEISEGKELTFSVAPAVYEYDPVIYYNIIEKGSDKVGYLVLENFDYECQTELATVVNGFRAEGITDLVLDLRYNPGGSVAQSRWLTSCIAGTSHLDRTFASLVYNDGTRELWQFRGGPDDYDGLGIGPDLGLDRVFVIGSYYTASASEMVVNSLRGIDYDVYLIGGVTEGKNVGMTSTYITLDGIRYMFSPITFRIENASGFGDYSDGLVPDIVLSDQDLDFNDGDVDLMFPHSFGDWNVEGANVPLEIAVSSIMRM